MIFFELFVAFFSNSSFFCWKKSCYFCFWGKPFFFTFYLNFPLYQASYHKQKFKPLVSILKAFPITWKKKPRFSKVGAEWKTTALEIKKKRAPVLMQQPTKKKALPACFKNKTKKTSGNFFSFIQIHQQAGNSLKQFGENSETNNRTKKKKSSWKIENP